MCDTGGVAAVLGFRGEMKFYPETTSEDIENIVGTELGVVRISLGLVSGFYDVHHVLWFIREVVARDDERKRV